jgi:dipeptidase E
MSQTLIFYSGHPGVDCPHLDEDLRRHASLRTGEIMFIPADDEHADEHFEVFDSAMKSVGIRGACNILRVDKPISTQQRSKLSRSKLIFLGGGNTFFLMSGLLRTGLASDLKDFAQSGGLLAGQSAGAIVMTPSIHLAGYPEFDRDENEVNLKTQTALKLVDFEFFPHYCNRPRYSRAMRQDTRTRDVLVYAGSDEGGIVVTTDRVIFVGSVWGFWRGLRFAVTPALRSGIR